MADATAPFIAGYRWFQKILTSYGTLTLELHEADSRIDEVIRARPANDLEITNVVSVKEIQKYCDGTADSLRTKANKNLCDMQHWSFNQGWAGSANSGSRTTAEMLELKGKAFAFRRRCSMIQDNSRTLTLREFGNLSGMKRLVQYGIKQCENISNMNRTYNGFWGTTIRQGKLLAFANLFATPIVGGLIAPIFRSNIIDTATLGWQVMSATTSADHYIIAAILHNAKKLAAVVK